MRPDDIRKALGQIEYAHDGIVCHCSGAQTTAIGDDDAFLPHIINRHHVEPGQDGIHPFQLPAGSLDPDQVHTPGIYVNRIIEGPAYDKKIEFRTTRTREEETA